MASLSRALAVICLAAGVGVDAHSRWVQRTPSMPMGAPIHVSGPLGELLSMRGGAKRPPSRSKKGKKKMTKKAPAYYDEDEDEDEDEDFDEDFDEDEDEDEDDDYYEPPPRKKASKRRPPPRRSSGSSRSSSRRSRSKQVVMYRQGPTLQEKLLKAGKKMVEQSTTAAAAATKEAIKQGSGAASQAKRLAKERTSSDFEKLLLRATAPNDAPISPDDTKILLNAVRKFPTRSSAMGVNPYEKTLHKLWNKIAEPDWRTTLKGTTLLHHISRDTRPRDGRRFADYFKVLKRARKSRSSKKKLKYSYFNTKAVTASLYPAGEPYAAHCKSYFVYVTERLRCFTARFSELQEVVQGGEDLDVEAVIGRVEAAQAMVGLALSVECIIAPKQKELDNLAEGEPAPAMPNFVVCATELLVLDDVRELWGLLTTLVERIVSGGDAAANMSISDRAALLRWWLETRPAVGSWLTTCQRSLRSAKLKSDPAKYDIDMMDGSVSVAKVQSALSRLEATSGGAPPAAIEEEEEEEEAPVEAEAEEEASVEEEEEDEDEEEEADEAEEEEDDEEEEDEDEDADSDEDDY